MLPVSLKCFLTCPGAAIARPSHIRGVGSLNFSAAKEIRDKCILLFEDPIKELIPGVHCWIVALFIGGLFIDP